MNIRNKSRAPSDRSKVRVGKSIAKASSMDPSPSAMQAIVVLELPQLVQHSRKSITYYTLHKRRAAFVTLEVDFATESSSR